MGWESDQPVTGPIAEETAIVLKTRWHPLWVFFFFLIKPTVTIDGSTSVAPWGEHVFQVEPGTHEVRVALDYPTSEARIQVEVARGQTVHLRYSGPAAYFVQEGKLEVVH
jgi:hypothetical protein